MGDELIDVVDPSTGAVLERRSRLDVHAGGLWHAVFHCLIIRPSVGSVLLQRRAPGKSTFPGKLDLSATGHLTAGERPLDGDRELREELGVEFDRAQLRRIGTRLLVDGSGGEGRNCERVNLFFAFDDRPIESYAPRPAEVSGLVEMDASALVEIVADATATVSGVMVETRASSERVAVTVRQEDLVPAVDGYWTVVAVMAERAVRGEEPLAI